jgi:thymidine phosphorylase
MAMAKPEQSISPRMLSEPLRRAKRLAEQMARVLDKEEMSDAAVAVALLTSGVVRRHAGNAVEAEELMDTIREFEDRLLAVAIPLGRRSIQ